MKFLLLNIFLLNSLLVPTTLAADQQPTDNKVVKSLRGGGGDEVPRKLQGRSSCIVHVRSNLLIDFSLGLPDDEIECEMDAGDMGGVSGLSFPIRGSDVQMNRLRTLFQSGAHASGESLLMNLNGAMIKRGKLFLPKGLAIALEKIPSGNGSRKLAVVTGDKPILVVRVIDVNGLARKESAAQIGDDVFGTKGDTVNLKSQLYGCSMGKLKVLSGNPKYPKGVPNGQGKAPGVMEVKISVSLTTSNLSTVRNAITTAVQSAIGLTLPGPYHHVMYVLEKCYVDCGWAAYAFKNSWLSVYQGEYYKQTATQVHELGHNFNLAHSGGLNGKPYNDHTCMMGNPLYSDDVGRMCYNPAKNWQIGWYNDRKLWLDPKTQPSKTVTMVGISNYLNTASTDPVVVKVETGRANDYFVGFNRATGVNANNDEGSNTVTVIQVDGENGNGYSQSHLRAKLGFSGDVTGRSYTIQDFGGTIGSTLTISVVSIDLDSKPAKATVDFLYESGGGGGTGERSGGISGVKGYIKINGKCLSRTNDDRAAWWNCYNGNNQKWRYDGSTKELKNMKNMGGKKPCLHQNVDKGKATVKNCAGFLNQQWDIEEKTSVDKIMIRSVKNQKCLFQNLNNDARVKENCNFSSNQSFEFVPV